jgi:alpha-tubulin suppressor-like RCC1 family protein
MYGFGANANGQLGDLTTTNTSTLVQESTLSSKWIGSDDYFDWIVTFNNSTYAIKVDGTLWSWGNNAYGKLGLSDTVHRSSPCQIGTDTTWSYIYAGYHHASGVKKDSSLWLWGRNTEGQLGDNTATHKSSPVQTTIAGTWKQVACGKNHTFAISSTNQLWTWGDNTYGSCGTNTSTVAYSSPVQVLVGKSATKTWAGYNTGSVFTAESGHYYWGRNDYGQLGLSDTTHRSSPTQMGYQNQWNQLSFGQFHTIATGSYNGSSNAFYTWGRNNYGQLGKNTITDSSTPALTVLDFIEGDGYAVAASADSSFVVRKNGTIWSWGRNYNNCSLGPISSTGDKSSPVQIVSSFVWQDVSGGAKYAVALSKNSSNLFASGTNTYGQLGDGFTSATSRRFNDFRQTFSNAPTWEKISAGHTFSLAIKQDSTLWAWGYNNIGQIGINNTANQSIPTQISGDFTLVSAGYNHAGAIKTDGSLVMFGNNTAGSLGDNTGLNRSSPVQTVAGGTNWSKLSCGTTNTGAIKTDGSLWMWGGNISGSLGINFSSGIRNSPVQIGSNTTWSSISCGFYHTAAIKTDGTLWTWGDNLHGQLGDNTTINRSSPIQTVAGGTTWSQVACGWKHTAAIKTNGTLWSWGDNSYGQLGDGTITQRSSPIQEIGAGTTWTFVSVPVFSNSTLALKSDNKMYGAGDYFPSSYSSFTQFYTGDKTWMRVSKGGYHILAISYGKSPSPSGPTMFWPDPVPKASGYALSAETLNASVLADAGGQLPGSIIYDPAKGTVLSVGTQTLYATSLPTENYNTQTISRTITIT